jgi:hypothetical protein
VVPPLYLGKGGRWGEGKGAVAPAAPTPGGNSKLLPAGEVPRLGLGELRPLCEVELMGAGGFSFRPADRWNSDSCRPSGEGFFLSPTKTKYKCQR